MVSTRGPGATATPPAIWPTTKRRGWRRVAPERQLLPERIAAMDDELGTAVGQDQTGTPAARPHR